METLKEIVVPSNFMLLMAAAGIVAGLHPATRRLRRWLLGAAATLVLALSSGWTATALLSPLEYSSPPAHLREGDPPAAAIVVLAAYAAADAALPISSWPNGSALFRIVETIQLRPRCPACDVIVTGGRATVDPMAKVLVSLGVPESNIVLDNNAANTMQSAQRLAKSLRGKPFYLVTSAGHMPRALLAFRSQGLAPLPAPTDYLLPREPFMANPMPSPQHLLYADLAVHEYLGILWYHLGGAR